MIRLRQNLNLAPLPHVRVGFEVADFDPSMPAGFECVACDELLIWKGEANWWLCPSCSYELTPDEAWTLVGSTQERIDRLEQTVRRRRGRWLWAWWLRKLLGLSR